MSQRYILPSNISRIDTSADEHEIDFVDNRRPHGSDLLSGSFPIKVIAYKVNVPLPVSTTNISNRVLNYTIELHIGEREKIGQGTFGYKKFYILKLESF